MIAMDVELNYKVNVRPMLSVLNQRLVSVTMV